MHMKDYIAVHIWKDKWWLFRPPFVVSLCIPNDPMSEHTALLSAQQQQSKYQVGLILCVGILLSFHLQVLTFM